MNIHSHVFSHIIYNWYTISISTPLLVYHPDIGSFQKMYSMVLWFIPLKMEDECSALEFFQRRDPKMNGTERPSVGEGISYDTYHKFPLISSQPHQQYFQSFTNVSSDNHIYLSHPTITAIITWNISYLTSHIPHFHPKL